MEKYIYLKNSVDGVKMPNGEYKNQNFPLVLGAIGYFATGVVCGITCICKKESAPWNIRKNSDNFINNSNLFSDEYSTRPR